MSQENLWAPWRMSYLRELERKAEQLGGGEASAGSFLADYFGAPDRDEEHHVVYRDGQGIVLLNRYPYANGHLLTAVGEPRVRLVDYEPAQRAAFWRLVEIGMELIQRTLSPQGINVGINEGSAAGAGVPQHVHAHLVPRWGGDTNFITVVGQIRVIPNSLPTMAEEFRRTLEQMG